MKLGLENRKKVMWLAVLMALAGLLFWNELSSGGPKFTGSAPQAQNGGLPDLNRIEARLHTSALDRLQQVRYRGSRRDLFVAGPQAMTPLQAAGAAAARRGPIAPHPVLPPQPAGPPPIPLRFYGYTQRAGQPPQCFLQFGGKIFIVGTGERVAGRYVILSINANTVQVRDQVTQNTQFLPLIHA